MATLKIQSKEDIIRAYFRNLGFVDEKLCMIVKGFSQLEGIPENNASELVDFLDAQIVLIAQNIWTTNEFSKLQAVALFKLAFLQCKGAECCVPDMFLAHQLPDNLCKEMNVCTFETAPEYVFSDMKIQKIVTARPTRILQKLWQHQKRN